jgi:predicted TPR repeat methyltransferase
MKMKFKKSYSYKSHYQSPYGLYKFNIQYSFIKQFTDSTKSVLDIGGGDGRFSIPLMDDVNMLTVIDLSKNDLEYIQNYRSDIKVICNDFIEESFIEKFSLIIAIESIYYFPNFNRFFQKIDDLLTDDGIFVFSFTNPKSVRYLIRKYRHKDTVDAFRASYNEPTLEELMHVLNRFNFEIKSIKGFNWMPFKIDSTGYFVSVFAFLENFLFLNRFISMSPWLMVAIKRKSQK